MKWFKKKKEQKPVTPAVSEVFTLAEHILLHGLGKDFHAKAKQCARKIGDSEALLLKEYFHDFPLESELFDFRVHGLGGWISACQFAIFEIFFNKGEVAIPVIRDIAWGEYDWTQGNAIELLIRLAADGIDRDEIVSEIKVNFPNIREEAQLYSIQPLIPKLNDNTKLKEIFEELLQVPAFKEAYDEILQ